MTVWLNRTVAGVGLTSALGDFCYETTTVILPGFLAVLGIPAATLGLIEGAADALASFTKMISGFIADKLGHRKALVLVGYALTPLGQALIALAAGWPLLLMGRLLSWFGKGLRGPLRDAIVIQAISPETRGRAFGFHRAMDTIGAVVGQISQRASATVTSPAEGRYIAHLPEGLQHYADQAAALTALEAALTQEATARALRAGAADVHITVARDIREAQIEGRQMFVEARITVTAAGRPRVARQTL